MTTGAPNAATAASASAALAQMRARAVGTPCRSMKALEKALLVSSRAAACDGPNTATPAALSASDTPAASGCSGPIDHEVDGFGLHEGSDRGWREDVEVDVAGAGGGAGVARGAQHLADGCFLPELPGERVFAPPAAEDQDLHVLRFRFGRPATVDPNAMREEVSRRGRSQGAGR